MLVAKRMLASALQIKILKPMDERSLQIEKEMREQRLRKKEGTA
jgi:hypothetical protein